MQSYASCGDLPLAATNHDTLKPQTCLKMFMFAFSNAEGAREFWKPAESCDEYMKHYIIWTNSGQEIHFWKWYE